MATIKIKLPSKNQVQYELDCLEDDTQVRGNAMASGDDDFDKKIEDEILSRLESGDLWAWCTVRVTATWKGIIGTDYLGACSYKNEKDFKAKGGYYQDMKNQAFDDLIRQIKELAK